MIVETDLEEAIFAYHDIARLRQKDDVLMS